MSASRVINKTSLRIESKNLHLVIKSFLWLLCCFYTQYVTANQATSVYVNSGDNVPGGGGRFEGFAALTINNSNQVTFKARLSDTPDGADDDSGIYDFVAGSINTPTIFTVNEVVRENNNTSIDGITYEIDDLISINNSSFISNNFIAEGFTFGDSAYLALFLTVRDGNETGDSLLAVQRQGRLNLVASAGAGTGNGTYREFNASSLIGISSNNDVTFFSAFDNTADDENDNTAFFRKRTGSLAREIVRKGDSNQSVFIAGLRVSDSGHLIFSGYDSLDASTSKQAIFYSANGFGYTEVISEGDLAPTDDVDNRFFDQISNTRINNNGAIGFTGLFRDADGISVPDNTGLYITANGGLNVGVTEIVREGQLTPDASASFNFFVNPFAATGEPRPAFNDNAEFAFLVGLTPTLGGQPSEGVFRASESGVVEIARKDDVYEDGTLRNFSHPVLNNQGVVAFIADLMLDSVGGLIGGDPIGDDAIGDDAIGDDGGAIGDDGGVMSDKILIVSNGQQYATVVREGDVIDGKEVKFFAYNDDTSGRTNGFNDASIIAYSVTYTDNSTGINIWNPGLGWQSGSPEGDWDDSSNWFMGMQPDEFTDVLISPDIDLDVQGPSEETIIKSLTIGGEAGVVRLFLNNGYLSVINGISVEIAGWFIGSGTLEGTLSVQGMVEVVANSDLTLGDVDNNGILSVGNGSRLILAGNYSGAGVIEGVNGITEFNGFISPGNSPALLDIEGSAVISDSSILTLELSGANRADEFDAIDTGGVITLDGVLEITLTDGYIPEPGQSFLLIQAGEIKGNFDSIQFPDVDGVEFEINATQTALKLNVSENTASSDNGEDEGGSETEGVGGTEVEGDAEISGGGGSGNMSLLFMIAFFVVLKLFRSRLEKAAFQ